METQFEIDLQADFHLPTMEAFIKGFVFSVGCYSITLNFRAMARFIRMF
ncbi:MAG TPA: hypothetical protein VN843_33080 [Anaerolineales bacterium]|nr:hypothetical protein [Anaerolineales bacterium]